MPDLLSQAGLISLAVKEAVLPGNLEREPEPMAMEGEGSVEAFHDAGDDAGALWPVYRFNALAMSALLPEGGRVFDLGSGSAQLLLHLAQLRPDVTIVGTDLSEEMLSRGRQAISAAGLGARIELIEADMTAPPFEEHGAADLISAVFSLHHLPDRPLLTRCIDRIAKAQAASGCSVWIFDHARPRRAQTAEAFPKLATPQVSRALKDDSRNSIKAAFSYAELSESTDAIAEIRHAQARFLPLYQAHWLGAHPRPPISGQGTRVDAERGTRNNDQQFRAFLSLWPSSVRRFVQSGYASKPPS